MSNQEILTEAIQKAIAGGFNVPDFRVASDASRFSIIYSESDSWIGEVNSLIFNHDFAKALWGGAYPIIEGEGYVGLQNWQYHLQMMVISPDPIQYLGEHL